MLEYCLSNGNKISKRIKKYKNFFDIRKNSQKL